MIEWSASDTQEILGYLFGAFALGWCNGYLVNAWKRFWNNF